MTPQRTLLSHAGDARSAQSDVLAVGTLQLYGYLYVAGRLPHMRTAGRRSSCSLAAFWLRKSPAWTTRRL